jgi:L-seryl-tRNA(Ser) seleniumtransferase
VLREPAARELAERAGHAVAAAAVRRELEARRAALAGADGEADTEALARDVAAAAAAADGPALRAVLNATGVIVHTNLGRAPLAPEAVAAVTRTAGGYANLELDLASGGRGSRQAVLEPLLRELTGAEAGLAVCNNAAAILLALAGLAAGREVVVSRGQLIEIGDGFRIPDILATSGARLVEVGTTNRTALADYERAIGPETAAILRVHPSNYRVVGFTAEVGIADLAALGARHGIPVIDDLGSGLLHADPVLAGEPVAADSIAAGATVACFSADKLLGGPQAGVVVGRREAVERVRRHPLARAVRIGKLATAALEATLRLHRDPRHARGAVPVLRMAHEPAAAVRERAARLADAVGGEVVATTARIGGGALPGVGLESAACALPDARGELASALRTGEPAVLGRLEDGLLLLDARTLADADVAAVAAAVARARGG